MSRVSVVFALLSGTTWVWINATDGWSQENGRDERVTWGPAFLPLQWSSRNEAHPPLLPVTIDGTMPIVQLTDDSAGLWFDAPTMLDRLTTTRRTWFGLPYSDPDAPGRAVGFGEPLLGTSWLNRPLHIGWTVGAVVGDDLIKGRTAQESDVFGGYRVGWDFDHYWGVEYRLAFARPDILDAASWTQPRIVRHWYSDVHVVHYPWGDSRWRPFLSAGIGWASFAFTEASGIEYDEHVLHVPVGGGFKCYMGKWMALRLDAVDNIAIAGSGLDTMHNVSVGFGVEAHFGPGTHRKYGF